MLRGFVYSVISATCFGMLPIFARIGYDLGLSATVQLTIRFTFAAAILFIYYGITNRSVLKTDRATIIRAAFLGIFIYTVQSYCFFAAVNYIPATTASLIFYLYPLTVALLAAFFFRQKITKSGAVALLLVTAGCALVFSDAFLRKMDMRGVFFAMAAMTVFSFYLILTQVFLRRVREASFMFYVLLFAGLAFTVITGPGRLMHLTGTQIVFGIGLGLVSTVFAVGFLYAAINHIGSAWASLFSTVEPAVTVIAAALLLGEKIVALQIGGMALIIGGITLPGITDAAVVRKAGLIFGTILRKNGNGGERPR